MYKVVYIEYLYTQVAAVATPTLEILSRIVAEHGEAAADSFQRSLNDPKVRGAKPKNGEAVTLADGGGLLLHVASTGGKSWRYRYRVTGQAGVLTIGNFPEVGLAEARAAHRGARWLVERGIHPLKYIDAEIARVKAERLRVEQGSFRVVAERWLESVKAERSPRTAKHRLAMAEKHVFPVFGARPVTEIKRREITDFVRGLDAKTPELARQCRVIVKKVLDLAVSDDLIEINPTPASGSVLGERKGERAVKPRRAMASSRVGVLLRAVEDAPESDVLTKAAMQLLVLTWCRTSEVVGAEWAEFNLDAGIWVIAPERMKAREPHKVYLSAQAVELLRSIHGLTGAGRFVFPNRRRPSDHMNRMTLTNWRKRWGFADEMQVHGLRATASTWANESGRYRPDVIEVALAHREGDLVRSSYNRAEYVKELRGLWQDWADQCDQWEAIARSANEVPIAAKVA